MWYINEKLQGNAFCSHVLWEYRLIFKLLAHWDRDIESSLFLYVVLKFKTVVVAIKTLTFSAFIRHAPYNNDGSNEDLFGYDAKYAG